MRIQNAVQKRRPDRPGLTLEEYNQFHDYPYANILGDTRNRSHKRVNRLTIFCIITLILYALCWIF